MCLTCNSCVMGDLLGSFLENMWVKTKYTKKFYVGLWGQSLILKAASADFWGLVKGIYEGID